MLKQSCEVHYLTLMNCIDLIVLLVFLQWISLNHRQWIRARSGSRLSTTFSLNISNKNSRDWTVRQKSYQNSYVDRVSMSGPARKKTSLQRSVGLWYNTKFKPPKPIQNITKTYFSLDSFQIMRTPEHENSTDFFDIVFFLFCDFVSCLDRLSAGVCVV